MGEAVRHASRVADCLRCASSDMDISSAGRSLAARRPGLVYRMTVSSSSSAAGARSHGPAAIVGTRADDVTLCLHLAYILQHEGYRRWPSRERGPADALVPEKTPILAARRSSRSTSAISLEVGRTIGRRLFRQACALRGGRANLPSPKYMLSLLATCSALGGTPAHASGSLSVTQAP
jgi:hypothetical protein